MSAMTANAASVPCMLALATAGLAIASSRPAATVQDGRGASDGDPPWEEILGPARGEWPEREEQVVWRTDLAEALREAREEDRPLFVTARCLPCQQCAAFDQDVLEGGDELSPLLARFVTLRLTRAEDLDLRLLQVEGYQDLDLSWWAHVLSPDGRTYAIFGGRDEVSDTTRVSVPALARTLERVLDHHADPRRAAWDVDGAAPDLSAPVQTPEDLPGYAAWRARSPDAAAQSCLHCHQVAEILREPALDDGTFDKRRDVQVWPLPENVGIVLDRDDGLLVTEVLPESPAARTGLEAGDRLGAAGDRRLFGQADLRGVLHRLPMRATELRLVWSRGEQILEGTLELEPGWRATVLDWRMSISQGNIGPSPGFPFPLRGPREGVAKGRMSVTPFFGKDAARSTAFAAGLRPHHVIVAVNGESPDLFGRSFLVWFRLEHEHGQEVTLSVLDRGQPREITYRLPERSGG